MIRSSFLYFEGFAALEVAWKDKSALTNHRTLAMGKGFEIRVCLKTHHWVSLKMEAM